MTGIGSAFVMLSCIRIATRWFPPQKMALISGLIVTMAMTGGVVSQYPLSVLVEAVGWRQALFMDAALGVFIIAAIMRYVENYPKNYDKTQETKDLNAIGLLQSLKGSYLNIQNWLAAFYTCLMNTPLGLLGVVWGSPYLMQAHGLTKPSAHIVTTMLFVGTIIGGPLIGSLSDKIGRRRYPMLIGALISLGIITLLLNTQNASFTQLIILFLALGFVTSTQVLTYPLVAEINPAALTATAVSVVSFTTQGGSAVLEPYFGSLLQEGGAQALAHQVPVYTVAQYHHAMMIIPVGFVIAFIAALFIRETFCQKL